MIYYKEEKKKLVIPSGFVMIPIDCDEAIEQAREQGYQEGFADGSSATCDTEEGTYSLTDDFDGEETVFPSEGKTGFNKIVIVDNGYGDAKYDEGVESQKGKLESITFTRNGDYTKEDGWSAVTVDVPNEINLGTLVDAPPRISDLTYDTYINTFDPQQASVDGWGRVEIGLEFIIGDAKNQQKALMSAATFTQNGLYRREDGWNEIEVNVPQTGSSCNLQTKSVVLTASTQTVSPDQGYDGMSSVSIDASTFEQDAYDRGYDSGYEDAEEEYPRIQIAKNYTANTLSAVIVPDTGYEGIGKVNLNTTPVFNSGYLSGLTACSGGTCRLEEGNLSIGPDWSGISSVSPTEGYDGFAYFRVVDNGYGGKMYDNGFVDSSSKIAYFGEPAWVDTNNNKLFSDSGMGLVMEFTVGSMSTGETLHLLNNSYDGNLMTGVKSYFSIDFKYTALTVTFYDGVLGYGSSYNIAADSSGLRYNNDTYRLIVRTLMSDTGDNRRPIQFIFVNESRGETYELNQNSVPNFVNGVVDGLRINCLYNETNFSYSEMCSGWYLKYLKIYKMTSWQNRTAPLAADIRWKDNSLYDTIGSAYYHPYKYENGLVELYSIPSADDEMFLLW